jgi:ATP-binding cassette subfamily C (CFTR/MRP) protein 1
VGTLKLNNLTASWVNQFAAKSYKYKGDINSLCIKEIDYNFEPGKLYAIVGNVGSGKSSMLYSALGELEIKSGSIQVNGSLAYIPQSVFLINDTIKNNILFGKEYDEERYVNAVVKSGFFADLKNQAAQDMTEIGERGVNLSGGQKQRIAIARALYAFADIYLMDDVLSALDAEVGKFVFDNLICGDLKDKTRILVTHATYLLHRCDEVLVMKDGQIQAHGKYDEIKKHPAFIEYSSSVKKNPEAVKNEEETV